MAALNEPEIILLNQFKEMITDLDLTERDREDMFLVSWLRARDLDLKKALEMLQNCLKWRIANDIAKISKWEPPASYPKDFPYVLTGEDRTGCPVIFVPFGIWDVRRVIDGGEKDIWLKYVDKAFDIAAEAGAQLSQVHKRVITQAIIVFDLKGLTMRQLTSFACVDTLLEVVRRFEANYPETLKAGYVINAPLIFNFLFNLIKPLLSGRTLSKLEIYGSNQSKWKGALQKHIEPSQIPKVYGGLLEISIGKGANDKLLDGPDDKEDMLCAYIKPKDRLEFDCDVYSPNTSIKWTFRIDKYDIGFSVIFNEKLEIISYKRYDTHQPIHTGTINCEKIGKYTFVFDNTYSKMTGKTLHYLITTILPTGSNELRL